MENGVKPKFPLATPIFVVTHHFSIVFSLKVAIFSRNSCNNCESEVDNINVNCITNNDHNKMAKDDVTLGVEMGKLEIEPVKINKPVKEDNPFIYQSLLLPKRSLFSRSCQQNNTCVCVQQKKKKNLPIYKRKQNKILKEPVLRLLQVNTQIANDDSYQTMSRKLSISELLKSETLSLCELVDDCNQLRISGNNEQVSSNSDKERNEENQWWKTSVASVRNSRESVAAGVSQAGSCSHQALNPPCDVTIDELASYFETLVHIPKKMSSMAEMMYI